MNLAPLVEFINTPEITALASATGIIGFILTLLTFILALSVKSKLLKKVSTNDLHTNLTSIIDYFEGTYRSISEDNIYSITIINELDLRISKLLSEYTFISWQLKFVLKSTVTLLETCRKDIAVNDKSNQIPLCKKISKIISLLRKERWL